MNISKKKPDNSHNNDEHINFSDIPELDESWFKEAQLINYSEKKSVSLQLDADVVEWYKSQDRDYQKHINTILRAYMNKQKFHA